MVLSSFERNALKFLLSFSIVKVRADLFKKDLYGGKQQCCSGGDKVSNKGY